MYCAGLFFVFVYICIVVGNPVIKRGGLRIPLTGLTLPHLCVCPKSGPAFQHYIISLSAFLCSSS